MPKKQKQWGEWFASHFFYSLVPGPATSVQRIVRNHLVENKLLA
jgi:hypothetical protein